MTTAAWLWLLAITLIWPVPAALARARRLATVPRAAVVLWQAVAVAALLAVFGASLATVQALAFGLFVPGAGQGVRRLDLLGLVHLGLAGVLLVLTVVALVKLNYVGIQVARRLRRHRSRHRDLVDLLAKSGLTDDAGPASADAGHDVRVLSHGEAAYAYCLPGRHARVVISDAALRDLTPEQVAAVIEHERAHLRARHDLLLEFFTVLYEAAGRRAGTQAALEQTAVLVELLADDAARRLHGPAPLIAALATMGSTTALSSPASPIAPPASASPPSRSPRSPAPGTSDTTVDDENLSEVTALGVLPRLRRLADAPVSIAPPGLAAAVYTGALALIAVPTVAIALPWLTSTWAAVR
ncbi:M56 family metallopeptidase [Kineosporia sp. J2-2]|uniref:M56 family metallopeptidase n=1 Tax=Kineosporia corallincola TaxID=2835133 RepID=A0ABS5TL84_9ACTN|nr:M56 family metallopeptidase [Kineosporia corallincola]MBT0771856.1 M56 family metallopeptidase [Kineosporia corallincola]